MNKPYNFSSKISKLIERYLSLKRALGRQYQYAYLIFKHLDRFLASTHGDLTSESFIAWIGTKQNLSDTGKREWMRVTRNLCLFRQRTDPACFVPDLLQFPKRRQAIQPYIFTKSEIIKLFDTIDHLKDNTRNPLYKKSIRLGLTLLYTAGLRRGELIKLKVGDYNAIEHTLLIRESKFHKSRLLPLSPDAWSIIDSVLKKRRRLHFPISAESYLFWHPTGKTGAYSKTASWRIFHSLFNIANIHTVSNVLPRAHDIRHSFAVHVLLRWYHEGIDVQSKLPMLSIYMGHVSIISTQYYLRFIEQIANVANDRFEKKYGSIVSIFYKRGAL